MSDTDQADLKYPPLPPTGFVRLWQIVGDPKRGIAPLFPVSRASFYNGIRDGRYPAPVKLGPNISAWRVDDIRRLLGDAA